MSWKSRLELAVRAGREAGKHTLQYFQEKSLRVETKSDASPVTQADREAEQLLRELIGEAFPEDAILGEEFGETPGSSGVRWILDPIDGTKSFIHGVPLYGTMIGVESQGKSVVGVVYLPGLDEMVYAAESEGAWWKRADADPVPARVSKTQDLDQALVTYTSLEGFQRSGRYEAFLNLQSSVARTRGWGDCYGYALVATGRADIMLDPIMHVWDCAALQPIVEEAGGCFTDWKGNATIHGNEAVAANKTLLPLVLEKLSGS